jgi:hypothetical protein
VCIVPPRSGYQRAIFFDRVHIVIVDYSKHEAKLYENAGSSEGELHIKENQAAATADTNDVYELVDMAFRYAIRFELIARIVGEDVMKVFERIGVKNFLERITEATTEEMRRDRFKGFAFNFVQPPQSEAARYYVNGDEEPEPDEEEEAEDYGDYEEDEDYEAEQTP